MYAAYTLPILSEAQNASKMLQAAGLHGIDALKSKKSWNWFLFLFLIYGQVRQAVNRG